MRERMLKTDDHAWEIELFSRISSFPRLIFAGLVKNAGKTTAFNTVNSLFPDEVLGLTSIGYDGEAHDAIYHHPKPPIPVRPGQLILTSEHFLPDTLKGYDILDAWGKHPQYGSWLILRITAPGCFRLAGPSIRSELLEGIARLRHNGATRIHVDGALNRLSHISLSSLESSKTMFATDKSEEPEELVNPVKLVNTMQLAEPVQYVDSEDLQKSVQLAKSEEFGEFGVSVELGTGVILSTGAAVGNTLLEITERTQHVLALFQLPVFSPSGDLSSGTPAQVVPIHHNAYLHQGLWVSLPSFLWNQDLKALIPAQAKAVYIKGALTDSFYLALRATGRLPQQFIVPTPAHVLLSPSVWSGLKSRGIKVFLLDDPHLALLTLSPWHPTTPCPTERISEALLPYSKVPLVDMCRRRIWIP